MFFSFKPLDLVSSMYLCDMIVFFSASVELCEVLLKCCLYRRTNSGSTYTETRFNSKLGIPTDTIRVFDLAD